MSRPLWIRELTPNLPTGDDAIEDGIRIGAEASPLPERQVVDDVRFELVRYVARRASVAQ